MAFAGASRPSATLISVAALLALLIAAASPAGASQLNLYKGKWCTGSFTACWDRQCCDIPSDAVSYQFYYNPDWKARLYQIANCSGSPNSVISSSVTCAQGVDFKSALLTDVSSESMQLAAEE